MVKQQEKIQFDHKGIGAVLAHNFLRVPPNQREYSWEEEHVADLLQDFSRALDRGPVSYFLGTLVFTASEDGIPEVADGQQRLATTMMLLAAIRDYFHLAGDHARVSGIEKYLRDIDLATAQTVPKLRLNLEDNDFFVRYVLQAPGEPGRLSVLPTKESHRRIVRAATAIRKYIADTLLLKKKEAQAEHLVKWVDFVRDFAQVIQLVVPDHMDAFMMFETLNDRGLKASQADLLKNYLFQFAGDQMTEAHQRWAKMLGTLESLGVDDIVMDYLRHATICQHGPTKEKEVFDRIRASVNSKSQAMDFLAELAYGVGPYSALFNPEHTFWNAYGPTTRGHVRTMLELKVGQIRPLMFAVIQKFSIPEAKKALRTFVSWSVRFLIVGGRGGVLDTAYGLRAEEVTKAKLPNAFDLAAAMIDTVANDRTFETVFSDASVSQPFLARYYLRALEREAKSLPEPEWIPNDSESINLEHVLPEVPGPGWEHIDEETAAAFHKRIGNMVLLPAKKNVALGNKSFQEKRMVYLDSGYVLTAEAGEPTVWNVPEIIARQKRLASLAVQTWPLDVTKPTKGGKLPKKTL